MSMRHAVLGLLDLSPLTGYDLKKAFDATIAHFWAGDQSQIYRTLAGLVEDGLARVETEQQETRPNRHVHHITDAGRAELDHWLTAQPTPSPIRDAFLARVFFAPRLPKAQLRALLDGRRAAVTAKLDGLEQLAAAEGVGTTRAERLRLATLRNGLIHCRAELAWLDELEESL